MEILLFIFMCLAVCVCLKMSPENMVLVVLLHIGARDFYSGADIQTVLSLIK